VTRALAAAALLLAACAGNRSAPNTEKVSGARAETKTDHANEPPTSPADGSAAAPWKGGTEITSNDGAWKVVYKVDDPGIRRGEPFDLDAWVFAADAGNPSTDVSLAVDAAMPQHGHGMNRVPRIEKLQDGGFRAEGLLFHMPGKWELYFDVARGPLVERAQVDVEVE
jgi:hypothetical protein